MIGHYTDTVAAEFYYQNYSQVISNDICVKSLITPAYWNEAASSSQNIALFSIVLALLWS